MNKLFYHIFENWNGRKQLLAGVLVTLAGSATAYAVRMRFVGLLNINPLAAGSPFYTPLVDSLVNILLLTFFLYLAAYAVNKRSRFIDILQAVMLSRAIFTATCLLEIGGYHLQLTNQVLKQVRQGGPISNGEVVISLLFATVGIFFAVASIWMLFAGFRTATNGKGMKTNLFFAAGILAATILSIFVKHIYFIYS